MPPAGLRPAPRPRSGSARPPADLLHASVVAMHSLVTSITAEEAGLSRLALLPVLEGVRPARPVAVRESAPGLAARLSRRLRDRRVARTPATAPSPARCPGARAVFPAVAPRAAAPQQGRPAGGAILATLTAKPSARIASIGCGGCRDLSLIQDYVPPTHGFFVLVDADADALAFARERFGIGSRAAARSSRAGCRAPWPGCRAQARSIWWSRAGCSTTCPTAGRWRR